MKKYFLIFSGLIIALSSLLVSCNHEEGGKNDEAIVCCVSVSGDENGDVAIKNFLSSSVTVYHNSEISVVATPKENCEFIGWFVGDANTLVSTDATYTFTVENDIALVAKFNNTINNTFVVLINGEYGDVAFKDLPEGVEKQSEGLVIVPIDNEITVEATLKENSEFVGWYIGDAEEPISTDAEYTFTVSESVTLVAKFNQLPLVALSCSGNGTVSFADSAEASQYTQPGSEVTVIATPGEGSEFVGWFVGEAEEPISTDAEYTFTVSESVTLVAKFNQLPLVALSCYGYGTVSFADSAETSQYIRPGSEVTVIATPGGIYEFAGWFVGEAEVPISTDSEYTFTVSESVTLVAEFTMPVGVAVDLGLSVKWASFNVGATKPEEYGGYYAWGEIEEKDDYSWSNYKWCNGSEDTMTKYCVNSSYGVIDNKQTLEPKDDVVRVKCGKIWRIPTIEEQNELVNECTWEWSDYNDVKGYKVTGPNGNSIFLPAAGYRYGEHTVQQNTQGFYWLNSLGGFDCNGAFLQFYYTGKYEIWLEYGHRRCYGYSVRPVTSSNE